MHPDYNIPPTRAEAPEHTGPRTGAVQRHYSSAGLIECKSTVEDRNLKRAVGRRVMTLCKLPHTSLHQALPQPEPTNGTGSARKWVPCTPAMAAGLTDHV